MSWSILLFPCKTSSKTASGATSSRSRSRRESYLSRRDFLQTESARIDIGPQGIVKSFSSFSVTLFIRHLFSSFVPSNGRSSGSGLHASSPFVDSSSFDCFPSLPQLECHAYHGVLPEECHSVNCHDKLETCVQRQTGRRIEGRWTTLHGIGGVKMFQGRFYFLSPPC